jgi:DNA-binding transcriptional LysR family regulator
MLMRQLEYLSALAREGHFGRAAQACYVSQPTLSASIRKLETELGVQIVQRGHRFEGFTPEGKLVLSWAHRILAEQSALRHELAIMRGGLSGVLRIGVIPTASTVAPLLTTPLQAQHPLVRVSIESMSSREIVHRLSEFDLDLGMTYVDGEPLGAVRVVPLYRDTDGKRTGRNGQDACTACEKFLSIHGLAIAQGCGRVSSPPGTHRRSRPRKGVSTLGLAVSPYPR